MYLIFKLCNRTLQRNITFAEIKTEMENGIISDVLTDDEIKIKIDQLKDINVLLPIDSKAYVELRESVKTSQHNYYCVVLNL